ncbi:hypothetical protein PHYSODRAFT_491681 [Phytophthora sojae]|uniref:Uncharacterized protein n=1 Tax=Phytophthora sojae (strain P6497) TaxID=1094619 RepID=G4ZAX9_PHYSP|nr:hypothetical protein PHYSODRAFT_491681 [Phytophthora sojae]EGZ20607.1 hypothetical protein PHYSODRAFT_491681 [Phytophthora sojae]|eukprot:XP_009523324.1 hypothetical protein PHYSODRAFT_491681 [Phytophthora sojae]
MGWGAMHLRSMLNHRFRDQPRMMDIVPTRIQLENRKAFLVRQSPDGWDVTNHASFTAWASTRVCSTRAQFESVTDVADRRMDDMLVLGTFTFEGQVEGEGISFGVIVTSRRVFLNVTKAMRDQGEELVCATDGTYKLHFGGWTVVDCGSTAVTWARGKSVHRFIPWAYMFVRSESIASYERMFQVISERAQTLDHSEAIASAFQQATYDEIIRPGVDLLRSARTHRQFVKMATVITENWIARGERTYAEWSKDVYLTERWNRWHINGAGVGGIAPSQQGIESYHSVIKKTCVPSSRASTSSVLQGILPRILRSDGESLCPDSAAHFCEGPVPPEMIAKAMRLVATESNYKQVFKGRGRSRRLVTIVFNTSKCIVGGRGLLGAEVDDERAEKFLHSLNGRLPRGIKANEVEAELLSLHKVLVKSQTLPEAFELVPIWSTERIQSVRGLLHCTCEAFVRSGWSHVLATLSILGLLNVQAAMASVPVRRTPGRPRTRRPALARETDQDGFYDVDRLIRLFLRQTGQPLHTFIGEVVALRLSDGVYKWSVRFGDGRLLDYEAEQLARAVNRAHSLQISVTS